MPTNKDFKEFKKTPFLSTKTVKDHLGLLDGYAKNREKLFKKIRRLKEEDANPNLSEFRSHIESCRHNYNADALHRLYFSTISSTPTRPSASFKSFVEDTNKGAYNFRNYNEWKDDFLGVAKASRGWAILGYSVFEDILCNIAIDGHDHGMPPGFIPFLVLDVWEHAYIGDFGTNRGKYIQQWFKHINWDELDVTIARWLPVVRSEDMVMKLTAGIQQRMVTLGIAKE